MSLIIAVDGPAASGKGTIAARLARTYGLPHLDTGLLYRAVGARLLAQGRSLDDEAAATQAATRSPFHTGMAVAQKRSRLRFQSGACSIFLAKRPCLR